MATRNLLTLTFLLASIGLSSTIGIHGESSPADDTKRCLSNEDCDINEYCGGRSPTLKRCIDCFDCAAVQRKPKIRTYDGLGCAEHQSECGECNDGYKESGGWCILNEFYTTSTFKSPPYMDGIYHPQLEDKDASAGFIMFGVMTLISCLAIALGLYGVCHKYNNRKPANKRDSSREDEETAGLYNRSYENPTAPPDEYNSPPPPYNHFNPCLDSRQLVPPTLAHARNTTALPFARGNGAGHWVVDSPMEQTGDGHVNESIGHRASSDDTEDSTDSPGGNAASTPPNDVGNEQQNAQVTPRQPQSQNHCLSQRNLNEAIPPPSIPRRSFQGPPPANNDNNPVLGHVSFSLAFQGFFTQRQMPNPSTSFTRSAPASPRRIDDTHVENLLDLQEPFAPSNSSLFSGDSGTGSGDHDRSVPSRSVSGGDVRVSDMDDSLFDDQSLDTFDAPAIPAIPDFNQVPDVVMEEEGIPMNALPHHHHYDEREE